MGMILRIASSRIVGQGDIVGRSGYFSLNLSANSVMRGRLDARRTLKSLVADLRDNTLNIDLKEILTSSIIQAVCLIEDIRNNRITFTNHPNWKSRINSIRSASNHPLNNYWGYIDMALDNFHTKEGQSMRTYLCQKEPGIKLDNKEETIVKETNLYKALTILYPDIYN